MTKADTLKIGLAQINPTVGDFEGNKRKIQDYIGRAEKAGLDIVVFPEMVICGYPVWDLATKPAFVDVCLATLEEIAKSTKGKQVSAALGFIDHGSKKSSKNRNALALIQNGKVRFVQHKSL